MLAVYLLEAGLLLLVVPWSVLWERNYFVEQMPRLGGLFLNHYGRGAVSGIGLLCTAAAMADLWTLWRRRTRPAGRHVSAPAPAADADVSR